MITTLIHEHLVHIVLTMPIFEVGLHFDLSYTPVKFQECRLHSCGIIADRRTDINCQRICKSPLIFSVTASVSVTTFSNGHSHTYTHSQIHKVKKKTPDPLSMSTNAAKNHIIRKSVVD